MDTRRPRHRAQRRRRSTVSGDKADARSATARHSGYPGGFREETLGELLARRPEEVIRRAVKGMLPRNKLGVQQLRKLKVYAGAEHPHEAQQPEPLPDGRFRPLMAAPRPPSSTAPAGARPASPASACSPARARSSSTAASLEEHFGNAVDLTDITMPFRVTNTEGRYNAMVKVEGGGHHGQAGAIRHGIARALLAVRSRGSRVPLRQAGFLTRDPRMKERKKYGLKRARKAPQYTKR